MWWALAAFVAGLLIGYRIGRHFGWTAGYKTPRVPVPGSE
jgi:hypothetical protein